MSNCLFEAAYEEILHRCNCTPSFHLVAYEEYPSICSGHKLTCMSKILTEIGKFNQVSQGHAREDMLERTCQRGHGGDMPERTWQGHARHAREDNYSCVSMGLGDQVQ